MPVWYYGICAEKNSVSIQLATNKTNTTCHSGLSQNLPSLPPSLSPPPLPHHMLVCSTILFTFLLANYLPLSPCLSGSRALSNRGNLSHSLIERLSGDYGEVRNKVVLRNHKHKPFLSLCWEIFFFSPAAVYHCRRFFFLSEQRGLSLPWEYFKLGFRSSYYRRGNETNRGMIGLYRCLELALHVPFAFLFNHSCLWCVMML